MAGYIEGCRMTLDPANLAEAIDVLRKHLHLSEEVARRSDEGLVEPGYGLSRDCRLDMAGMRNVLALRAEMQGQWGGKAPAPERYLELGYYEQAHQLVTR